MLHVWTTDRSGGSEDGDAVLTSYEPGTRWYDPEPELVVVDEGSDLRRSVRYAMDDDGRLSSVIRYHRRVAELATDVVLSCAGADLRTTALALADLDDLARAVRLVDRQGVRRYHTASSPTGWCCRPRGCGCRWGRERPSRCTRSSSRRPPRRRRSCRPTSSARSSGSSSGACSPSSPRRRTRAAWTTTSPSARCDGPHLGASFFVASVVPPGGTAEVTPDALAGGVLAEVVATTPGARAVEIAGTVWVRTETVAAPDETRAADVDVPTRRVTYLTAVPDDPQQWVLVSFSTIGDGDPDSEHTLLTVELFDAIMGTWRWATGPDGWDAGD